MCRLVIIESGLRMRRTRNDCVTERAEYGWYCYSFKFFISIPLFCYLDYFLVILIHFSDFFIE
jgi:hypothetical protein